MIEIRPDGMNKDDELVGSKVSTPGSNPEDHIWTHKKTGGRYFILAFAKVEADLTDVVVYGNTEGIWVISKAEFFDGRFERTVK